MAAADDAISVQNAIAGTAIGPQVIKTDAGEVTQRSASDLIAASNYLAGLAAMGTKRLGVRYTRLRPGATVQGWRGGPRWRDGGNPF